MIAHHATEFDGILRENPEWKNLLALLTLKGGCIEMLASMLMSPTLWGSNMYQFHVSFAVIILIEEWEKSHQTNSNRSGLATKWKWKRTPQKKSKKILWIELCSKVEDRLEENLTFEQNYFPTLPNLAIAAHLYTNCWRKSKSSTFEFNLKQSWVFAENSD